MSAEPSEVPLLSALSDATNRLAAAGVPSPRWDAEQIAAHVLGVERRALSTVTSLPLRAANHFTQLVAERATRVPLQHLVGHAAFRHIDLEVGPGVFVPRPETELVAGWAIDAARVIRGAAPCVVDLCTGSGAIALAVADELPHADVHAVDDDEAALRWAARNVEAHAAAGGAWVTLHAESVRDALPDFAGVVDVVVANPPYLTADEVATLDPEVRDHDPAHALVAPDDGLVVIRDIVATAARLLRVGGVLAVEHGDTQGRSVPQLLRGDGRWSEISDHDDLARRPRFTTARLARRAAAGADA
ncbi:MAG: peptide chain release factor N(5)-glutamine methyltransferase [Mycobacteriales bacterium]|nr:peptide chain release factor N(5)-glutamine methyltransferase [Frankia sp.]